MSAEPTVQRVIAYIDGQNLFHHVKSAFGHTYPNYDVQLLALAVCRQKGWSLQGVHFYTGSPSPTADPRWNGFWINKLGMMGRRGVKVYSRQLVYRDKTISIPGFGNHSFQDSEEKESMSGLHWMSFRELIETNSMSG